MGSEVKHTHTLPVVPLHLATTRLRFQRGLRSADQPPAKHVPSALSDGRLSVSEQMMILVSLWYFPVTPALVWCFGVLTYATVREDTQQGECHWQPGSTLQLCCQDFHLLQRSLHAPAWTTVSQQHATYSAPVFSESCLTVIGGGAPIGSPLKSHKPLFYWLLGSPLVVVLATTIPYLLLHFIQ